MSTEQAPFDESFDVIVVGFGIAGGIAAIEVHDAGAKVLLIEKMPDPGGISILSGGALRCADDAGDAFAYLKETNAGTTPDEVIRVLADGMVWAYDYVKRLAEDVGERVSVTGLLADAGGRYKGGNYPFPGFGTFYNARIAADNPKPAGLATVTATGSVAASEESNDALLERLLQGNHAADGIRQRYPNIRCTATAGGPYLFRVIEDNVRKRAIDVRLGTAALRLITDPDDGVVGLLVADERSSRRMKAHRAVVLACGGFEGDEDMKRQFFQAKPVLSAATRGNTGDGIRMAQAAGAALWHMWHYHGSYAFRHPDLDFPFALRVKRLPDWNPLDKTAMTVPMVWIVVDNSGRRFMNECPPYAQDTSHRPMELFDPETQKFPRIPAFLICDEDGRARYRLGDPRSNDREYAYDWSDDNFKEIASGILKQVPTIADLAVEIGTAPELLQKTIERWNELCARGNDEDFGRPPGSMMPIKKPPFIVGRVWPTVSNTQGGPVHDERQRVLDPFNIPISRLYAAGELGSSFGHLYLSGGNIAECVVTGRIAGQGAAAEKPWA